MVRSDAVRQRRLSMSQFECSEFPLSADSRVNCQWTTLLFAHAVQNIRRGRVFILHSFLGGIRKILGPFGIADLDFLGTGDASFDTLAAVAPAFRRAEVVDAPVFMRATFIDAFHDCRASFDDLFAEGRA